MGGEPQAQGPPLALLPCSLPRRRAGNGERCRGHDRLDYAHPYPKRSRANRTLLEAVRDLPDVDLHPLYDLYPDFGIDVEAEQEALGRAQIIVWQHPLYWYSVPGLLKHWFDKVLVHGWAYGEGGNALRDKTCLWVATTGGDDASFSPSGMHAHPFAAFVPAIEQTARFCGMHWEPPIVVHGAHRVSTPLLRAQAEHYRARLIELTDLVREHFPKLKIIARARNVTHYFELRARGVVVIERETFESALGLGRHALEALGVAPYEARERSDRFRRHNVRSLEELVPHYQDETRRLSMAKAAREELERQFERDRAALERMGEGAWQTDLEAAAEERPTRPQATHT